MSNLLHYFLFWSLVFLVLGSHWYVIDRQKGVKWYRKWYNLTHRTPLPDDVERGFIYNRSGRYMVSMAIVLSTIQSLFMWMAHVNPIVELFMWAVEIPIMLLGFMLGPVLFKFYNNLGWICDKVKEGQQVIANADLGEVAESVRAKAADACGKVTEAGHDLVAKIKSGGNPAPKAESPKETPAKPTEPPPTEEDPYNMIGKFTKR